MAAFRFPNQTFYDLSTCLSNRTERTLSFSQYTAPNAVHHVVQLTFQRHRVLIPPVLLLLALKMTKITYRNYAARVLSTLSVAISVGYVIATVKIKNPSLAFMTGLLGGWVVIWAAVLLVRLNPTVKARRRRWSTIPQHDGEYKDGDLVWQRYPQRDLNCRLIWTLHLLISFRGVGWNFGDVGEYDGLCSSVLLQAHQSK
jgi:hypothetical protein